MQVASVWQFASYMCILVQLDPQSTLREMSESVVFSNLSFLTYHLLTDFVLTDANQVVKHLLFGSLQCTEMRKG